jgi:MYXO-CTERM domain-containing protein
MRLSPILVVTTFCWLTVPAAQADNICNETVPTNRAIDGIPAYAQCDATTGAIYSNNGVDTATTSAGTGWVRTQMSGGYQCTELAHRYLYFRWNVKSVPNGNAGTWCDSTPPAGLVKSSTPAHGDLIVFAPGSCGADATTGHVAVVDVVNSSTVTFVEQNRPSRRSCAITTAACFLHATANDGNGGSDGGVPDGATVDAIPLTAPDARPPRDLAADRMRPDSSGAAGTGETSAVGGSSGSGGQGGLASVSTSTGEAGRTGGSVTSQAGGAQGGAVASSSPSTGSTGTPSTAAHPDQDAATPPPNDKESSGCSCAVARHGRDGGALVFLLGMLLIRRRRPRGGKAVRVASDGRQSKQRV